MCHHVLKYRTFLATPLAIVRAVAIAAISDTALQPLCVLQEIIFSFKSDGLKVFALFGNYWWRCNLIGLFVAGITHRWL